MSEGSPARTFRGRSSLPPSLPPPTDSWRFSATTLEHRRRKRHPIALPGPTVGIVDLFSGCGACTLGAAIAVIGSSLTPRVALAVDVDPQAVAVYRANFPGARIFWEPVESLLDGDLGAPLTEVERALVRVVGPVQVLLGGPPCQGHSDLNNHTRREDPRNSLYARMARAIEVFKPDIAAIENVPTVVHSAEGVVEATSEAAEAAGYETADATIDLSTLGVPQRRRRHVLLATSNASGIDAPAVMRRLVGAVSKRRDIGWALSDLSGRTNGTAYDMPTVLSADNAARIEWLFEHDEYDLPNELRPVCHQGDHSYLSMYGRLKWTEPAQTITTGFGSMGQGRYVHPREPRMLTAHEAARLQGIPDYFRFEVAGKRTAMRRLIGNAAPPALSEAIVRAALELASA